MRSRVLTLMLPLMPQPTAIGPSSTAAASKTTPPTIQNGRMHPSLIAIEATRLAVSWPYEKGHSHEAANQGGLSKMLESRIEDPAGGAAISAVQRDKIEADPKGQQECDDPKHSP